MSDGTQKRPRVETPGIADRVKMSLFVLVERLSAARSMLLSGRRSGSGTAGHDAANLPPEALWVFVTTLGELNAIHALLDRVIDAMGSTPLVLLTDHPMYFESFRDRYPSATLIALDGSSTQATALASGSRPRLLLIAEIPCRPHDAPCRFPMALLHRLKQRQVPVALVNGWLYRERPASRLDALEQRMFDRQYLRLVDVFAVQTEEIRDSLVAAGAHPDRVVVTGNLKFDAADSAGWSSAGKRSERLLRYLLESGRPSIVAGCVTALADQTVVVEAFESVLRTRSNAMLVIVPRHPERLDRLAALEEELDRRNISHIRRTRIGPMATLESIQCMILDTLGELRDFYAASTISYVGPNHNVLEPLAHGKPKIVSPGWEQRYPSYPVYRIRLKAGAIEEIADGKAIGRRVGQLLNDASAYAAQQTLLSQSLAKQRGAAERCMQDLRSRCFLL